MLISTPPPPPIPTDSEGGSEEEGTDGASEDLLTSLQDKLAELDTAHETVVKSGRGLANEGGKTSEQLAFFKLTALGMLKVSPLNTTIFVELVLLIMCVALYCIV